LANIYIAQKTLVNEFRNETKMSRIALNLLSKADTGIAGVRLKDEIVEGSKQAGVISDKELLDLEFLHRGIGGAEVALSWDLESAGTKTFFRALGNILPALEQGLTVVADELDLSMHPLMAIELLKLFLSERTNPKGAQIVFTTHNPLLLDTTLLRRDQVWFTEKNERGESNLYPLTDYQPRKGESLVRGYLSGRYGGIPFMPDGFNGAWSTPQEEHEGNSAANGAKAEGTSGE
jgi:AAA15 family ATPase/GTPase